MGAIGRNIHPSQATFVPNLSIGDNSIINHEVMHYLNGKQGKQGYIAIKFDVAKAYDYVEWPILLHIMKKLWFLEEFCDLVHVCISCAKFSILINGAPYGFFPSVRGLRQGDPILHGLLTLVADILSRLLAREEAVGRISKVKVSRASPKITHLLYADNLVIYRKAVHCEAAAVAECLHTYCGWTRQAINFDKSSSHFSHNVKWNLRSEICHILQMHECDHKGLYLGLPYCNFKSKTLAFQQL